MPQTRSATRSNTLSSAASEKTSKTPSSKRKTVPLRGDEDVTPSAKRLKKQSHTDRSVALAPPLPLDGYSDQPMIDAVLTFSFEDAKAHLIGVDSRFAELFERLKCKPFEHLDQVHPFRSLVQSILAQQVSWLAARSITHKFIRLYDPSLPEKPTDSNVKSPQSFFPTPHQVANTDIVTLRSAGLSTRKAEYVKDLAMRFADGRLSTTKLLNADDEELVQMLTEVRGIGKWTVDMFAIFTLRRPNILPVGDLGIQRGMLRWFGGAGFKIRSDKVEQQDTNAAGKSEHAVDEQTKTIYTEVGMKEDNLPPSISASTEEDLLVSSPALPLPRSRQSQSTTLPLPTPVSPLIRSPATPSNDRVHGGAFRQGNSTDGHMKAWTKPLPNGLTPTSMKSRLSGKKVKGVLLTPQEMEALATEWAPYRSLAAYYMWALTDQG
ncbi:DNA glycosylase [Pisolithus thermaeus]|nr:DNA glycosylase [Pisolithus thermaeus]